MNAPNRSNPKGTDEPLTEREHRVLEAVIRTYVETAEPAGSRTLTRRWGLDWSPATVRNTMSDLEEKGYLYHPHTSAGRVPTDRAYRFYVNWLLEQPRTTPPEIEALRQELERAGERVGVERLVRHAAAALGLLARELGVAISPQVDDVLLERLDLVPLAAGKALLVLHLRSAGPRTVFVDLPADVPPERLEALASLLHERLAGLTLGQIRASLPERLREGADDEARALLNIFIESADSWFAAEDPDRSVFLGQASVLVDQPEFRREEGLRQLLWLTEQRALLRQVLGARAGGLQISIGAEHGDPALTGLAVVTSEYRVGDLKGVIGVIGPTRMPYERVIALVEATSHLVSEFLG